jgi:uncharacterized cupredoxin-like copper-binding protein
MLKRVPFLIAVALISLSTFAQHAHHHMTDEELRKLVAAGSSHGPMIPQPAASIVPTATKAFTVTARSFTFTTSPSPFTVNQGDTVQLTFTVPSNDPAPEHGLLMEAYFDGFTAGTQQPFNVKPGQSVTKTFTATTTGTFLFACNAPNCGTGHSNMIGTFTVTPQSNPAPTVTGIAPSSGTTAGGTFVTIAGTNFASGATVSMGGSAATGVNVTGASSLTASTPAHAAGIVSITVANADGQSGTLSNAYTYVTPSPTLTGVNPSSGPTSGNTLVTLTGTNFQSGATVTINGVAATDVKFVDSTTLTARTPLGPATEQVGLAVPVKVTNPDQKSITSNLFTYTLPAPAVSSLTPPTGLPAGGNVVAILGVGFTSAVVTTVKFGGVNATNVQIIDAVSMKATVPAHAAGAVDVVVTVGGATTTATNAYVYGNPTSKKRAVKR